MNNALQEFLDAAKRQNASYESLVVSVTVIFLALIGIAAVTRRSIVLLKPATVSAEWQFRLRSLDNHNP